MCALVPNYLPYVPYDPMIAGGKPIQMTASTDHPLIYSAGDDGIDDGGSEKPTHAPSSTGVVGPWQRRDFVVRLYRRPPTTQPVSK